jgi:uncharacterized membrane protein
MSGLDKEESSGGDVPEIEVSRDSGEAGGSGKENISDKARSISVRASTFVGPIPPPDILNEYNQVLPNAADRIIQMAENEQKHRHSMQEKLINAQIDDAKRDRMEARLGQVFGLVIGTTSIAAGSITAIVGAPIAGAFIGTAGVTSLVAVFVIGRKKQVSSMSSSEIEVIEKAD